jgi:hypothetical protein
MIRQDPALANEYQELCPRYKSNRGATPAIYYDLMFKQITQALPPSFHKEIKIHKDENMYTQPLLYANLFYAFYL